MNGWTEVLVQLSQAMAQWLLTPYFYLVVLLVAWRNWRLARDERRMLHASLHEPLRQTVRQLLEGLGAGLLLSALLLTLGVVLHPAAFSLLWGFTLLLFLFRRRWQPPSAAVGLFWLAGLVFLLPPLGNIDLWWRDALDVVHWPAWLTVLGLLQWGEAWLLRRSVRRQAYPMILEGRRGLPVGGYRLEGWWPLPLFVWGPGGGFGGWPDFVPWWPLFSDGVGGWAVVPLPLYAGFAFMSRTALPAEQAAWWQTRRLLGGSLALALAAAGQWWPSFAAFGVPLFLLWELSARVAWSWRERNRKWYFLPDKRGIKVLAVVPGSPAAEMGILPGEVVVKVNGEAVATERQLYHAVQKNPAFCKVEVLNHAGEVRFAQRALYQGEHHQLGIIAVPTKRDDEVCYPQGNSEAERRDDGGRMEAAEQSEQA